MKVAITGATGNIGTSLIRSLSTSPTVGCIIGIARRPGPESMPKTEWHAADVATDDLTAIFEDVDVVVHLAWAIQPSRKRDVTRRVNVSGSAAVFEAAARAGVGAIVYSSSVGAYSPRAGTDRQVDETWPVDGIDTSFYSRDKADVETVLDTFEKENPGIRVVRLRPALIFKRETATGIRKLFFGMGVPRIMFSRRLLRIVPDTPGLVFQAVHSHDVGEAFRLAITGDSHGAFNLAADPVFDADELAETLNARKVPVPRRFLRGAAAATWRLHLQPSPEGWIDMATKAPIMDSSRARTELGWRPRHTSREALLDLLQGLRDGDSYPTPALSAN